MDPILLGSLGLAAMFALILLHVPIGVAMGVTGVAGFALLSGTRPALSLLATETSGTIGNLDLAVIPLFMLMGSLAGAAGLSADIYTLVHAFVGHRRGGLALATIGGCAGFGAVCGSSIATAATFTRVALPEMLARRYAPTLASGSVAAGGTLGILVPPSVIMVIYAVLTETFIVDLFIAAIIPAILAVLLHALAIAVYVRWDPQAGPAGEHTSWGERLRLIRRNWALFVLAGTVMGGLYGGIFAVNEAAAVGVAIAFLFALIRKRLTRQVFLQVLGEASATTAMVYVMLLGANIYSYFLSATRMPQTLVAAVGGAKIPGLAIVAIVLVGYVILGTIFDEVALMVLTLPVLLPVIASLGYSPVWWGIINVTIIEIGLLAPPIGLNVFVIHGIEKSIPISTIYEGIMPFLCANLVRLAILTVFPALSLVVLQLLK